MMCVIERRCRISLSNKKSLVKMGGKPVLLHPMIKHQRLKGEAKKGYWRDQRLHFLLDLEDKGSWVSNPDSTAGNNTKERLSVKTTHLLPNVVRRRYKRNHYRVCKTVFFSEIEYNSSIIRESYQLIYILHYTTETQYPHQIFATV